MLNSSKFSTSQRRLLAVSKDDILMNFMYQIGIMMDEEKNTRHVEITYAAHYHVPEESEEDMEDFTSFQQSTIILTYRFIRDYTTGVEDSWTINALNHVSMKDVHKDIFGQ